MKIYFKRIISHFTLQFFVHILMIKGVRSVDRYYHLREDIGEVIPVMNIQVYPSITLAQDCAILCNGCHSFYYSQLDLRCFVHTGSEQNMQFNNKAGYRMYQKFESDKCESMGFSLTGNICFHVVDISMSWNEARSVCKTLGADLMTIKTKAKHISMVEKLEENPTPTRGFAIGMTDTETEGQMKWVDGEVAGAKHPLFYNKQPNNRDTNFPNEDANCVVMKQSADFLFVDVFCESPLFAALCEIFL